MQKNKTKQKALPPTFHSCMYVLYFSLHLENWKRFYMCFWKYNSYFFSAFEISITRKLEIQGKNS